MLRRFLLLTPLTLLAGCSEPPSSAPVQSAESQAPTEAVPAKPETFDWPTVTSEDGAFLVQLPSPGTAIVKDVQSPKGSIHMVFHKGKDMEGMFFNLIEATYPEGHTATFSTPMAALERLAEGARIQKENCEIEYARPLEGQVCPAFEMRFKYPGGVTGEGKQHASGYQVYRSYLIGDTAYQVFVDVVDVVKEPKAGMIDDRIDHMFSSIQVDFTGDRAESANSAASDVTSENP